MQKIGYTLSPESAVIEYSKEKFQEALDTTGEPGYEYIQNINKNEIVSYRSCVIYNTTSERVAQVKELYNISPNEFRKRGEERHYVFFFTAPITKKAALFLAENLSVLYDGSYCFETLYHANSSVESITDSFLMARSVNMIFTDRNLCDTVNDKIMTEVNDYEVEDVMKKLKTQVPYDPELKIIPGHGKIFDYAYDVLGSVESAQKFFNEHFHSQFITDASAYAQNGVTASMKGIIEANGCYLAPTQKGEEKQITDFTIQVHYKIIRNDSITYLVSLLNKIGDKISQIEWKNTTSEQGLSDFILKYGPFHFFGTKDHAKRIHEMIAMQKVPSIYVYHQYGLNDYKGNKILILPDAVYDLSLNKLFPIDTDLNIYFLGGNDGIKFEATNSSYSIDLKNVPHIGEPREMDMKTYLDITAKVYNDDSQYVLWMIACSMMGYALYEPGVESPLFFLTGVSGTGKSTFASILARAFGIRQLYSIGQSTVFPLKMILSSLRLLPVFMTEYRSTMSYKDAKDETLRLTFDKGNFERGQQNGTVTSYKLSAQVFLEGEDMYESGSVRTRTIVHRTSRAGRKDGLDVKKLIESESDTISTFMSSYFLKTDRKTYMDHYNEAYDIVKKPFFEPRIIDNFRVMYAGCMAFAPEYRKLWIDMIDRLMLSQQKDFQENSATMQVVKLVGQYLGQKFSNVYFDGNHVIFNWNDVIAFIDRNRKKMELTFEACQHSLEEMGFDHDMFQVTKETEWGGPEIFVVDGFKMHVKDVPKQFWVHKDVYQLYLTYQKSLGK